MPGKPKPGHLFFVSFHEEILREGTTFPAHNGGTEGEIDAAFSSAVLVDRTSEGKLVVKGADGLDLLHRLSTNDILSLKPNESLGTVFATDKGRVVDYVRVLRFPDFALLKTSSSQEERLKAWIEKYTIMEDVQTTIATSGWREYRVVGPETKSRIDRLFEVELVSNNVSQILLGEHVLFFDVHDEFGFDSVDVLFRQEARDAIDQRLMGESANSAIPRIGEVAYETFRIFHGVPQVNHELTLEFNPYEVGLLPSVSFTKGCYIGQEVIARLGTYDKVRRKLVRLNIVERQEAILPGTPLTKNGEGIGVVTSLAPALVNGERHCLGVIRRKIARGETVVAATQAGDVTCLVAEEFERVRG